MIELPRRSRPDIHADINIVPYIDVMLVLLVIFMMTTPILEQGVEIALPNGEATVVDYQEQQPSIVYIDEDGNYFINPMISPGVEETEDFEAVSLESAIEMIIGRKGSFPDMQLFVKADYKIEYEKVIAVVTALKKYAKFEKIGLMTKNPNPN